MSDVVLNKCPFCGSKAVMVSVGCIGTQIGCTNGRCDFTININGRDSENRAVVFWNRLTARGNQ